MNIKILIVDDDERILDSMKRILKRDGYKIGFASNGLEALKRIKTMKPHMIISDFKMPIMDGITFLKRVRKEHPEILTIMVTGVSDVNIAMEAINDIGIYKFLIKPFDFNYLRTSIKRAVEILELRHEKTALTKKLKERDALIRQLEKEHPGITRSKGIRKAI